MSPVSKSSCRDPNPWMLALLLAGLTLALFWPALGYGSIDLDDPQYVFANPRVLSGLGWDNLRWAFTTVHEGWWLPMLWMSYMLDATLWGTSPMGFHGVNILLHTANVLLLFWALRRSTGRAWESAFVAALFALHPLRVESVAWIAQRKDVLSGFFWMLAMAAHLFQVQRPSLPRRALVFLLMLLALMSKASAVSLPLALLLMDFWPLRRIEAPGGWQRCLLEKIPLFFLSALFAGVTLHTHTASGGASSTLGLWERLTLIPGNYFPYLAKTFWPTHLSIYHPENDVVQWIPFFGAAAILVAITFALWRLRRPAPYLWMGWLWFGLLLGPVIRGIRVGHAAYADRFLYLPSIGLAIMAAWGLTAWLAHRPRGRMALGVLATAVLAACWGLTTHNLRYWRNSDTLFTQVWELDPDNYLGVIGRGAALQRQERWEEALAHFNQAVDRTPHVGRYRISLALVLINMDRLPEVFALLKQWKPQGDHDPEYHYALGLAYLQDRQPSMAILHLARAIELNPRAPLFYRIEIARAYFEAGDPGAADKGLRRAWNKNPAQPFTYADLFPQYTWIWESGERPRALQYLRNLAEMESGNATVLNNIAWFLAVSEPSPAPPAEPLELALKAQSLAGNEQPVVVDTLAAAYANAGQFDQALVTAESARRLARDHGNTGLAGRLEERIEHYRQGKPWRESVVR